MIWQADRLPIKWELEDTPFVRWGCNKLLISFQQEQFKWAGLLWSMSFFFSLQSQEVNIYCSFWKEGSKLREDKSLELFSFNMQDKKKKT